RTREEVVARIAQGKPDFEPDAMHRYSNAGYVLLGYIVEKAGGKPYQEALKERIASRIGLKDKCLGTGKRIPARTKLFPITTSAAGKKQPNSISAFQQERAQSSRHRRT